MKYGVEQMFKAFSQVSPSKYPELLKAPRYPFAKRSKMLAMNLLKDVNLTDNPRLLVLTGHLYFDYILQKMLDREQHNLNGKQQESFHAKAVYLHKAGRLDSRTFACFIEINRLRNNFAHQIFYDLSYWSPANIPFVQEYGLKLPKKKNLLFAFNIVLLRLCFFALIVELEDQHSWLTFENVPRS